MHPDAAHGERRVRRLCRDHARDHARQQGQGPGDEHVFADDELERLCGFPEINKEELTRFFTLTPADVGFIDPGRVRSPKDRPGLAVSCARCPGSGSSRTASPRRHRRR
ncbi:hypothetical protein ACE1SV_07090 [Streptomyces sp. E-15]